MDVMPEQVHQNHEVSENHNAVTGPLVDLDGSLQQKHGQDDEESYEQDDRSELPHAEPFFTSLRAAEITHHARSLQ